MKSGTLQKQMMAQIKILCSLQGMVTLIFHFMQSFSRLAKHLTFEKANIRGP